MVLPLQGVQVQSLVGELRSCVLHGTAKKKKKGKDNKKKIKAVMTKEP